MTKTALENKVKVLYKQSNFPVLQNRLYGTIEQAISCPKGELQLVEDLNTGLIYNAAFSSALMSYEPDYNSNQGVSPQFRAHLEEVALLIEAFIGGSELVEVGCGKGFFLEMLLSRGVDIVGFDPTYDGDNNKIIKKYFEPSIISSPAQGLVLRHVLEHIPDPVNFLFELKNANNNSGLIYIEVPCFDTICKQKSWFDIYYEHVNYFRLSDLIGMFDRIIHSGKLFGNQYIYVIADLATLRQPIFKASNAVTFPSDFLGGVASSIDAQSSGSVGVWGGASKGCIFSLLKARSGHPVDFVIDVNPAKQGLFLPGTGLQVMSPEFALDNLSEGSTIFVMNPNYLEEIKLMSNNLFNYVGV